MTPRTANAYIAIPMREIATISEVARRADVSVATVSRALRGLPHVSPVTRQRVLLVAAELGYRPNPHASRLAAGRSGTVGVALPVIHSWFYANVLAEVDAVLSYDGVDLHLVTVGGAGAAARFAGNLPALSKQVDAFILADVLLPDWDALASSRIPIVTLGHDTGGFDAVQIDNRAAASDAISHLIGLGHRRIGFVGGGRGESAASESAELRRQGMIEELGRNDLAYDPGLDVPGHFSVEGGRDAMAALLRTSPPTAVFCASDEMAIGAMWAAEEAGFDVPGDVAVVGFDDQPVAAAVGLTTIRQPVSEMAAMAASMILERLADADPPARTVEMPTELRIRRTTDLRHLTGNHARS